jgi:hypothetical protein
LRWSAPKSDRIESRALTKWAATAAGTQTLTTPQFSRNLGLDPTNHRVFVAAAKSGPAPAGGRGRGPLLTDSFSVLVIEK